MVPEYRQDRVAIETFEVSLISMRHRPPADCSGFGEDFEVDFARKAQKVAVRYPVELRYHLTGRRHPAIIGRRRKRTLFPWRTMLQVNHDTICPVFARFDSMDKSKCPARKGQGIIDCLSDLLVQMISDDGSRHHRWHGRCYRR